MDEGLKALTRSDRNRCRQPRRSVAWVAHRVFWQSRGDLLDEGISGTKGGASSDLGCASASWRAFHREASSDQLVDAMKSHGDKAKKGSP